VSGWGIAGLAAGIALAWSGLTGQHLTTVIQNLVTGRRPPGTTQGGPAAAPVSSGAGTSGPVTTGTPGPGATGFAVALLKALDDPVSQANIASIVGWQNREGLNQYNNPLNTTLQTSGSVGVFNSAGVQEYGSIADGVQATVQTLMGGYPSILSALRSGQGLGGQAGVGSELLTWSGGGYSSV
jgi:hypothetical protein